jgi:photosystem II stability/assembly factor-like uncharacterized protein
LKNQRRTNMAICVSHGGTTTYQSSAPSSEVFVGTVDGVVTLQKDDQARWRVSAKALAGQHVHALLIEPQSGFVFAGVHKGSVYVSKDGGVTWDKKDNGLTQPDVYCLAATVNGKSKVYVGTEPAHLFVSEDLGESWRELESLRSVPSVANWTFPAPPHVAHVKNIAFQPDDSRKIYVCVEQGGLLKSDDGGSTWQELHGFDTDIKFDLPEGAFADDIHRVLIPPTDPNSTYISSGIGVCRSQDQGKTWEHLTTPQMRLGYPDPLVLHPRRTALMFAAGARENPRAWRTTHDADSTIARSRDGGKNWEVLETVLPGHLRGNIEAMAIEVCDGSSSLFAATTDGDILFSDNEGDRWSKIAEGLPAVSKGAHYLRLR